MKAFFAALVLSAFMLACHAQETYELADIQGAWWADKTSPTADFAISGNQVWLDYDSAYHPCVITDGNVLVFDLGSDGRVEHKIVSANLNTLVLEHLQSHQTRTYTRDEPAE